MKLLLKKDFVDYTEYVNKDRNNIEINSIQYIENYTIFCNTVVKYSDNKKKIILTSLIKINTFPELLEPMLKSYTEDLFNKQRHEEEILLMNNSSIEG